MYSIKTWMNRDIAPVVALVVVIILYVLDCLLNAMINPIFILTCGGLSGLIINNLKMNNA